jgi:hypothetical protein
MAGLYSKDQKIVGGKYLVMRRDGTVPDWPYFVLGARDPIVPWVLRFYAIVAFLYRKDWKYVKDVWALARDFHMYKREHGAGDPDGARHRVDNPDVISKMKNGA